MWLWQRVDSRAFRPRMLRQPQTEKFELQDESFFSTYCYREYITYLIINVEVRPWNYFISWMFQIQKIMTENSSAIFTGHRPLGYVANHLPLVTRYNSTLLAAGRGLLEWYLSYIMAGDCMSGLGYLATKRNWAHYEPWLNLDDPSLVDRLISAKRVTIDRLCVSSFAFWFSLYMTYSL